MKGVAKQRTGVTEYMHAFPRPVQVRLRRMRAIVKSCAPDAEERMSYGMPAYFLHGRLLYFAGFKHHIGFYPMASGIAAFEKHLKHLKHARGSVQFPHDRPFPVGLIGRIVRFRAKENRVKNGNAPTRHRA